MLNIVDEQGNVIGTETREKIHREGLLHKIIHVWFFTPDKQLIFQHRSKKAETHPDLLDATVGGHVEIGQTHVQAAVAEVKEETGIIIEPHELILINGNYYSPPSPDKVTNTITHHLKAVFAYPYRGAIDALHPAPKDDNGITFEVMPIEKVLSLPETEKKKFIPSQLKPDYLDIFRKISELNEL